MLGRILAGFVNQSGSVPDLRFGVLWIGGDGLLGCLNSPLESLLITAEARNPDDGDDSQLSVVIGA